VSDILSDVKVNEFKDPSVGIGQKFAEWRERFEDSYQGAWGGLGLVGAWEFWARLEMLGWNPFEVIYCQLSIRETNLMSCYCQGLSNTGQLSLAR
jgi:hypothetical protein